MDNLKAWREAWTKRAREAKKKSRKSDADLAEAITERAGRSAGRAQVNHFFTGTRDPTLGQFYVLCEELGADPGILLFNVPVIAATQKSGLINKALSSKPEAKATYAIQEKRLEVRRNRKLKRRPVDAPAKV